MIVTATTIVKWLKMTQIKNCNKIICPCADKLRKICITKTQTLQEETILEKRLKTEKKKYKKCFTYLNI